MEYKPPKKPAAALLLVAVLASAAASLLTFAAFGIGRAYLSLAASLLFFALSFLIISRYVVFDCLYKLGEDYSDSYFSCYVFRKKRFYLEHKIEFNGKEALILLDKAGRKRVKKLPLRKDMTSNLIPKKRYALLFYEENTPVYITVELDEGFAALVKAKIDHAKKLYQGK
ncbi:MAG: hypothetical protein IJD35_01845 [Clostridia bacterium]|nr:hypothetical protein [Clostridia bacterium]